MQKNKTKHKKNLHVENGKAKKFKGVDFGGREGQSEKPDHSLDSLKSLWSVSELTAISN